LLDYTGLVFDYWHDYKDGRLDRATFVAWLTPVRLQLEATLEAAVAAGISGPSGAGADILEHRQALWNFVDQADVQPTNNHAKRPPMAKSVGHCRLGLRIRRSTEKGTPPASIELAVRGA
jgi:hypothetical protein